MKTTLPPELAAKLADFRRRVWIVKLAEGILAALCGLALSYLLVFALDRFFETPGWVRGLILLAGASTLGLGLPLKWHRWVWKQRRLEDVARLLRLKYPRLGDQLLGLVELARREEGSSGRSERLVQAAMSQTAEAVKNRDFTDAVPKARHRQWGFAALGLVGLALIAFFITSPAAFNALARWLMPWRQVERFTYTRLEPLPQHLVVPFDEPFHLPVKLSADTKWSPHDGYGTVTGQPRVTAPLATGTYAFEFPPQRQNTTIAFVVGDARKHVALQPKTRPELDKINVHLRLPAYLGYKTQPTMEVRDATIGIVKGAQAAFDASAIRAILSATVDGKPQAVTDGRIVTGFEPVNADSERELNWRDSDGLTPREPLALKINAVDDAAPTITAHRDSTDDVILDSEVVSIDLTAQDDFGVKQVGLSWIGSLNQADNKSPIKGEKVSAAGAPELKDQTVRATFCATREGLAPQTVEIRAWVDDYLPGRPHSYAAAFVLHILNKEDHALWLTSQFGKWLEAAKETYEKEQQLNQTNKDLARLKAAELDQPENRRRVAQQASEENENAARLGNLTQSGRHLVEQATKNDEFDAKRLETWATMIKSLKDIAANRMPNVSDLLKQTADAPANPNAPNSGAPMPPTPHNTAPMPAPNSGPTVAGLQHGQTQPPATTAAPANPNAPKPPAPSLGDSIPSFNKPSPPKPPSPNAPPAPPGGGKLGLPSTTLGAAPNKDPNAPAQNPPGSPAQQSINNAVNQQNDLLAEFAKVSGQLNDILTSLEASTFVRRFKAASQQQMKLATHIDQQTLSAFGVGSTPLPPAIPLANTEKDQSKVVGTIESDLDAYYQRKQDARFKATLDEMKKTDIVHGMAGIGVKVSYNLSGQALSGSEYWADTLDRWAEEMVAASHCKSSSSSKSSDSLPPEIVLKVMKSLRDEMKLRDETREAENAKAALAPDDYQKQAQTLGQTQADIGNRTSDAMGDIAKLPDGEKKFGKELGLLKNVVGVMGESQGILAGADTGPKAIGAESEAIELLLQSKRPGSKPGGGGGGSTPGQGGGAQSASQAALADFGPGAEDHATLMARTVGQATGVAGKNFPDEFKTGLDSYFSTLEKQSSGQ